MGFLDNSGDIIIQAVLTDVGRKRMANGRFNIKKFALGDDEINYALYRNGNHPEGAHPSGSSYYDLEILQTPIFEAFTNAHSSLKSHLVSYANANKLYLPVLRINDLASQNKMVSGVGIFYGAVDEATRDAFTDVDGVADMFNPGTTSTSWRIDQGIDEPTISPSVALGAENTETQYIVYVDNRLMSIARPNGRSLRKNFVDDDNIARYTLTAEANPNIVVANGEIREASLEQIIRGPRGTTVTLTARSSLQLRTSNTLFDLLGAETTFDTSTGLTKTIRYIDTTVRIVGATTGYGLDFPVRLVKLKID